jgi:uncharacterized coiled-coil protein SlyX
MATQAERLAIVETKTAIIEHKVDDLKGDVKEMHDCLDRTRDLLDSKLDKMMSEYEFNRDKFYQHADALHKENKQEHATLANKISDLEKEKHKFTLYALVVLGFAAGAGWIGHIDLAKLIRFVGL